ncbi:AccI family restriction endonuclease [Bacillus kwashiorkori]|uniref:AccI family restriction endonuclease n=1 Tax=Bacillus kwashiorkori TaxID=1522318 RepID=UPI00078428AB|nr:AccI family restriction endonuclease [Bacillus kwashiorkori]
MTYKDSINVLLENVPEHILSYDPNHTVNKPTQASSDFLINKEQGDWAEEVVFNFINRGFTNQYRAVRYGKNDDKVAGEDGFNEFYYNYQEELRKIGKRPDLLIYESGAVANDDISRKSPADIDNIVKQAKAGFEVRSSSFLTEKYFEDIEKRVEQAEKVIKSSIQKIKQLASLQKITFNNTWQQFLNKDLPNDLRDIEIPAFRGEMTQSPELMEIKDELKKSINILKRRHTLSFTPKVEDIYAIARWVNIYNVPHYYVQVFFDKIYAISFKRILEIISDSNNQNKIFTIERNRKNQMKQTIHIDIHQGEIIGEINELPPIEGKMRKLARGRLLFYIGFGESTGMIYKEKFRDLING